MILVRLSGGLGNQMFQYAAGRSLSLSREVPLKLDLSLLADNGSDPIARRRFALDCFRLLPHEAQSQEIDRFLNPCGHGWAGQLHAYVQRRLPRHKRRLFESDLAGVYNESFPLIGQNAYLCGYWQSEKYFLGQEAQIRKDLEFRDPPSGRNAQLAARLADCDSVSLHVRRGDYVSNPLYNRIHGTCSESYYRDAIQFVRKRLSNPVFYVFSDDVSWCRANLKLLGSACFVDSNVGGKAFEDMRLMSLCRHHIIANSSFSWWGAWLGGNPQKIVVAPKRWFRDLSLPSRDLVPRNWMRL